LRSPETMLSAHFCLSAPPRPSGSVRSPNFDGRLGNLPAGGCVKGTRPTCIEDTQMAATKKRSRRSAALRRENYGQRMFGDVLPMASTVAESRKHQAAERLS